MYEVIKGALCPKDRAQKAARRGVVFFRRDGFVAIAPATTYPGRTGRVPPGCLLLTQKSPAYKASGFDAEEVGISIRDIYIVREDSVWMEGATKVGHLNVKADPRLEANLKQLLREFPPTPSAVVDY